MFQTYIALGLSIAVLLLVMQTAKAWQTARSLRQIIETSPTVCGVCATKASEKNHNTPSDDLTQHTPGNGGIYFADTHPYVPSYLVLSPPPHGAG